MRNSMRRGIVFVVVGALALCFISTSGYSGMSRARGWGSEHVGEGNPPVYYDGVSGHDGTAPEGVDINGEVGRPLYVGDPYGSCVGAAHWSWQAEIVSGNLPPGITLQDQDDQSYRNTVLSGGHANSIQGIPTERGHWVVTLRMFNLNCDGRSYMGFTQQLRFHITGTGKVIE